MFEDVTGRDLSQFSSAGIRRRARRSVSARWVMEGDRLTLTLGPGGARDPRPAAEGTRGDPRGAGPAGAPDGTELLPRDAGGAGRARGRDGRSTSRGLAAQAGVAVPDRVIPSLLRGFSAPVILDAPLSARGSAGACWPMTPTRSTAGRPGRSLMRETLLAMLTEGRGAPDPALFDALGRVLEDETVDPAFSRAGAGLALGGMTSRRPPMTRASCPTPRRSMASDGHCRRRWAEAPLRPAAWRALHDAMDPGPE